DAHRHHLFLVIAHYGHAGADTVTAAVAITAAIATDADAGAVIIIDLPHPRLQAGAGRDLYIALGAVWCRAQAALIECAGDHFLQLFAGKGGGTGWRGAPAPTLVAGKVPRCGWVDGRLDLLDRRRRRNRRGLARVGVAALACREAQAEQGYRSVLEH